MLTGVFTVMMGKEYDIPGVAGTLAENGWEAVEWRVAEDWHLRLGNLEQDAQVARLVSDEHGLQVVALSSYVSCLDGDTSRRLLTAAPSAGASMVRLQVPSYDGECRYDDLYSQAQRALEALHPVCLDTGVTILLETHMGNIIPSASAARRLVDGLDPACVGIIYDPGNMVAEGMEQWRMGIQILGPYLAHVHVKNLAWRREPDGTWKSYWAPLEEGIADWRTIIPALRAEGYAGALCLEDFTDAPAEQRLRKAKAFLQPLLSAE